MLKTLFIIGSYTELSPESIVHSEFTTEQRMYQLRKTIDSIHHYSPESEILLVEGSSYDIRSEKLNVDYLMEVKENKKLFQIIANSSKSAGAVLLMLFALKNFSTEPYHLVFKISARYELTEKFNVNNFSTTKYTFYDHQENGYETSLFSYPGYVKNEYENYLLKSMDVMRRFNIDSIEIGLRNVIPIHRVYPTEILGVRGYTGSQKTLINL